MKKIILCMLTILLFLLPACTAMVPATENPVNDPAETPAEEDSEEENEQEQVDIPVTDPVLQTGSAPRLASPGLDADSVLDQVYGNNQFAFDLYQQLIQTGEAQGQDLFYSPYSLSSALAMVYAGAEGNTAAEMQNTLHFNDGNAVFEGFNALNQHFERINEESQEADWSDFQLLINNAVWSETTFPILKDYLDQLSAYFGAGIFNVDFIHHPDTSREQINSWVAEKTNEMIQNLLAPGTINADTRVVLTNTIYFIASWQNEFMEEDTKDESFTLLDGSQVQVPMMNQREKFSVGFGNGYEMIELPYIGNHASMIAILPTDGTFEEFEANLTAEKFEEILSAERSRQEVQLAFPKFDVESSFSVNEMLQALGMQEPFDPATADFSGITGNPDLYISNVIHKAVVKLDEKGTEAAAATAVTMSLTSAIIDEVDPIVMRFDRPFIFAIINPETGSILFMGRVMNPLD